MFRRSTFPIPLNYIDAQRETTTSIGVLHEATIGDYWKKKDGDKSLSELCIGVTRFALLDKNPPEVYMFKADSRRNGSKQDQPIIGQKNGQTA